MSDGARDWKNAGGLFDLMRSLSAVPMLLGSEWPGYGLRSRQEARVRPMQTVCDADPSESKHVFVLTIFEQTQRNAFGVPPAAGTWKQTCKNIVETAENAERDGVPFYNLVLYPAAVACCSLCLVRECFLAKNPDSLSLLLSFPDDPPLEDCHHL